jgi:hypothetical protein
VEPRTSRGPQVEHHDSLGEPDRLLVISASDGPGTTALALSRAGSQTGVKELWHSNSFFVKHGNMQRTGDVLTAVDVKTGKILWRERGYPEANLVHAEWHGHHSGSGWQSIAGRSLAGTPEGAEQGALVAEGKRPDPASAVGPAAVHSRPARNDGPRSGNIAA